ncbi:hypothetical protein [Streptomyces sp. NPDC021622]|uniref:hypothetical protein n=1 Tax=Streptomyces sp. NPDC021622 TaxID=3155013 RepID=UPI0033E56B67
MNADIMSVMGELQPRSGPSADNSSGSAAEDLRLPWSTKLGIVAVYIGVLAASYPWVIGGPAWLRILAGVMISLGVGLLYRVLGMDWVVASFVAIAVFYVLARCALWGAESVLSDWQERRLGPDSAPEAVVAIVSLGTMIGLLAKAILSGIAVLVQSKGTAEADKMRAQAQLRLADAEYLRAQKGLPPGSSTTGTEGGPVPAPAEPEGAGATDA